MYLYFLGKDESGATYEGLGPVTSKHATESAVMRKIEKSGGAAINLETGKIFFSRDGYWDSPEAESPLGETVREIVVNSRKVGRPRTASEANRKAGGNPPLLLRLTPDLHEAAKARGGASWVRSLIEKELKEDVMTLEKFASNAEFPAISWESDCPEEFDLLGTFPDSWGLPFPVDLMGSVDGRGKWQWDGCGSLSDRQGLPIRRITVYERD